MADFRERWFRVGTCTEPADRPCAEAVITRIYGDLGASPPRFVWCDSPLTAQLVLYILGGRSTSRRHAFQLLLPTSQRDALGDMLEASPGVWMGDIIQDSVKNALHTSLCASWMRDMTPTSKWNIMLAAAAASLREAWRRVVTPAPKQSMMVASAAEISPWGTLRSRALLEVGQDPTRVGSGWGEEMAEGGQVLSSLVSILRWRLRRVIRILRWEECAVRVVHLTLFLCLLPAILLGLLRYLVLVVHGFSRSFLRKQERISTADEARRVRIERYGWEARRVRIERYGWERYLAEVGATVLDRRRNDIETTRETLLQAPGQERVLVCACPSTARVYALEVPRHVRTCEQAQAWLSGGLAGRIINSA